METQKTTYIQLEGAELITQKQVCEITQFCPRTVLAMVAEGEFPRPVIHQARRRRWSKTAVLSWIKRRSA
jgi:predicted DNA-binding transcriptional regulator AlpA